MTTQLLRPDNSIPLVEGAIYNITPGEASSQWVRIIRIERGYVYTEGVGNTVADWKVPTWKFDDLVKASRRTGQALMLEVEEGKVLSTEVPEKLLFGTKEGVSV